jgi:hypothetical protein
MNKCDKCGKEPVKFSTLCDKMLKNLDCMLVHSKVPKMTEEGIIWVCKEGCKNFEEKKNDNL